MYWYLAENSEGKRGVMPINFVEVCTKWEMDTIIISLVSFMYAILYS